MSATIVNNANQKDAQGLLTDPTSAINVYQIYLLRIQEVRKKLIIASKVNTAPSMI